jgi:hypothetical protein
LGKRGNFTFRVRDTIRDQLTAAAQSSNVSVSEEIERRIEQSFSAAGLVAEMLGGFHTTRLVLVLVTAIQEVERTIGRQWQADPATFKAMQAAIWKIIASLKEPVLEVKQEQAEFGVPFGSLAELGRRYGPFIDHFAIGSEAADLAMSAAQAAVREVAARPSAPKIKGSSRSPRKGKQK